MDKYVVTVSALTGSVGGHLRIVKGTNMVPIQIQIKDFNVPEGASALVYAKACGVATKVQTAMINDNAIEFTPEKDFFVSGENMMQGRITKDGKDLITFAIVVICTKSIVTDDAEETSSDPTLLQQLLDEIRIINQGELAFKTELDKLAARLTAVENDALRGYGARRKVGGSTTTWWTTTWERVGAAVGLVAKAAVGNGTVQNDFMASVYPYNSVKPCNVAEDMSVNAYLGDADFQWDGSNGDVMLEVPQVYTARYFETDADGVEWEYRWVAAGPVGRCHLDHAFTDGDRVSEKIYIPIFNGSLSADGTKLESKAGVFPLHNKTRAQFRGFCTAKGEKWCLDDVWTMHLLDTLFIVMFASTHAQSMIGKGRTEMPYDNAANVALQERENTNYITIDSTWAARFTVGQGIGIGTAVADQSVFAERTVTQITESVEIANASNIFFDGDPVNITTAHHVWSCIQKTGATIEMQSANGRVEGVDGRTAIRFLYIEDWYGNGWQFRDGDNIKAWQHYYCNKRSSYADKVYDGDYFKVGYEAAQTNGYVKKFGYDPEWPEIEICVDATGSSGTYFPDHYYQAEDGKLVCSGGDVYGGVFAGPFFRRCDKGAWASYWSLCGRPLGRK